MNNDECCWTNERIPEESRPAVVATLWMLRESKQLAVSNNHDTWSLAVELPYLLAGGSNITILRWLVLERLVEHKIETTRPEAKQRRFQSSDSPRFGPRSCFVLSDKGLAFALSSGAALETILGQNGSVTMKRNGKSDGGKTKPHWDRMTRKLSAGSVLVKHFQVPAANQEQVLLAFQRQRWRRCIPNPLPPSFDPGKSLQDVVRRLNERQRVPLLRFHTTNSGDAVWWELLAFPAE